VTRKARPTPPDPSEPARLEGLREILRKTSDSPLPVACLDEQRALFAEALTHASLANQRGLPSNQRLEMLGDSVRLSEGYRSWWSYIPHFIHTPGYVYAYAYGQLLALSVYARYEAEGPDVVPAYIDLLSAGGSMPPEELGKIVGVDLADPGFWDAGIDIIERHLNATLDAAAAAGRLNR